MGFLMVSGLDVLYLFFFIPMTIPMMMMMTKYPQIVGMIGFYTLSVLSIVG